MKLFSKILIFHVLVSSLASATSTYCVPPSCLAAAPGAAAANRAGATTAGVAGAWTTGATGAATYGAIGASNAFGTALKSLAALSTATDLAIKAGAQWGATAFEADAYGAGRAAQNSARRFAPPAVYARPAVWSVPPFSRATWAAGGIGSGGRYNVLGK